MYVIPASLPAFARAINFLSIIYTPPSPLPHTLSMSLNVV